MMYINGRVGQVIGPFKTGQDLLSADGPISEFTPETTPPVLSKLGIQAQPGTEVQINNAKIRIGRTGVYEVDNVVSIKKLIFLTDTDDSTLVDFIY